MDKWGMVTFRRICGCTWLSGQSYDTDPPYVQGTLYNTLRMVFVLLIFLLFRWPHTFWLSYNNDKMPPIWKLI